MPLTWANSPWSAGYLHIVDDFGAVLVIALFYSDRLSIGPMIAAVVCLALLVVAARLRIRLIAVYAVLVVGVWIGVLTSGIHATVAGILLAMVVPVGSRIQQKRLLAIARQRLAEFEASRPNGEMATALKSDEMDVLEQLHQVMSDVIPVGPAFERLLHPITAYIVLPLFALFNAGVLLDSRIVHALTNPVGLGVLLGLMVGKPAGIMVASWVVIRCRLTDLPDGTNWGQVLGAAILAGIGFTMAIFVSDLALDSGPLLGFSKVGVLTASALCATGGYYVLHRQQRRLKVILNLFESRKEALGTPSPAISLDKPYRIANPHFPGFFFAVFFFGLPIGSLSFGTFQYGVLHFAQRTGTPGMRLIHSAPQRRHRQIILG